MADPIIGEAIVLALSIVAKLATAHGMNDEQVAQKYKEIREKTEKMRAEDLPHPLPPQEG